MARYYPALLKLHTDPVDCVKYRFVDRIINTRAKMSPDVNNAPFLAALDAIQHSSSCDLAELASHASETLRREAYITLYDSGKDSQKEAGEQALKLRESSEKEEAKRKHIDALAQKARKDYLKSEQSKKKLVYKKSPNVTPKMTSKAMPKVVKVNSSGLPALPKMAKANSTPVSRPSRK